jgi:hypothetical protein
LMPVGIQRLHITCISDSFGAFCTCPLLFWKRNHLFQSLLMFKFKQVYTNQITSRLPGETSFDIIDMPFFTYSNIFNLWWKWYLDFFFVNGGTREIT